MLCFPDEVCSVDSSILTAGSLASGSSRLDQPLRSPGSSKSYKTCSAGSMAAAIAPGAKARTTAEIKFLMDEIPQRSKSSRAKRQLNSRHHPLLEPALSREFSMRQLESS